VIEPPETEAIDVTSIFRRTSEMYSNTPSPNKAARCPPPDNATLILAGRRAVRSLDAVIQSAVRVASGASVM
jgi:hypothetical protein